MLVCVVVERSVSFHRSLEGGLLTLVLRGKTALIPLSASLEIEDLVTMHISGPNDILYSQIISNVQAGGFKVFALQ